MDTPVIRSAGAILVLGLAALIQTRSIPAFFSHAAVGASGEPSAQMLEIQAWRDTGDYPKALAPAQLLYNRQPRNPIYIQQLAEIQDGLGHFPEEADLWEQFMLYAPAPIEGCPQIGAAYLRAGWTQQAIGALEKCLAIESNNVDVLYYLGYAWERAGDRGKAGQYYAKGLAYDPNDADLNVGIGRLQLQAADVDAAAQSAAKVLEKFPENTDALLLAGIAAMRRDDLTDAKRWLEHAAMLSARYADVHVALGQLAERQNHRDEALQEYRRALGMNAGDATAKARIAAIEGGR